MAAGMFLGAVAVGFALDLALATALGGVADPKSFEDFVGAEAVGGAGGEGFGAAISGLDARGRATVSTWTTSRSFAEVAASVAGQAFGLCRAAFFVATVGGVRFDDAGLLDAVLTLGAVARGLASRTIGAGLTAAFGGVTGLT